jgi:hypothetical protein
MPNTLRMCYVKFTYSGIQIIIQEMRKPISLHKETTEELLSSKFYSRSSLSSFYKEKLQKAI